MKNLAVPSVCRPEPASLTISSGRPYGMQAAIHFGVFGSFLSETRCVPIPIYMPLISESLVLKRYI